MSPEAFILTTVVAYFFANLLLVVVGAKLLRRLGLRLWAAWQRRNGEHKGEVDDRTGVDAHPGI
jgi:hypothetical protein